MRKLFIPLALAFLLMGTACQNQSAPQTDEQTAQKETPNEEAQKETEEEPMSEEEAFAEAASGPFEITMTAVPAKKLPFDGRMLHGPDLEEATEVKDIKGTYYLLRNQYFSEGRHYMSLGYYFWDGKEAKRQNIKHYDMENCNFDLVSKFPNAGFQIADEDKDGEAEIYCFSQLDCVSDVSPTNLDLHVFEGQNYYQLAGNNKVEGLGGEFKPSDNFKAEEKIFNYASDIFNSFSDKVKAY